MHTNMHFLSQIQTAMHEHTHTRAHTHTHTHTPGPISPVPTPLVALLASVCVSCVEGHQDIPQPAPRLCSAAWNGPGLPTLPFPRWTDAHIRRKHGGQRYTQLAVSGVMFGLSDTFSRMCLERTGATVLRHGVTCDPVMTSSVSVEMSL